jgi:hypothetical protein
MVGRAGGEGEGQRRGCKGALVERQRDGGGAGSVGCWWGVDGDGARSGEAPAARD